MFEFMVQAYVCICLLIALMFGMCFWRVSIINGEDATEMKTTLFKFLASIAPKYILAWPWYLIGNPLAIAIEVRVRSGAWRPWPEDWEALKNLKRPAS